MKNQQNIIELAKNGDTSAFEQIVREYSRPIFRYVCNVVGHQQSAEDVSQAVFLKVHQRLRQFDPQRGSLATWIYRIARNTALNHLRSDQRAPQFLESPWACASAEMPPDAQAGLREQFMLLDDAVANLPPHQRSAWVLSELQQMSQAEIAEIEGIPEGTVKSRVSRAKEALRKVLQDQIGLER